MIRALVVVALLAGCGGAAANPCQAIEELEALDERFRSGDIATALEDFDRDNLTAALATAGDEAAALRDELAEAEADPQLIEAAGLFTRAVNLMDATISAETIRRDDLEASLEYLRDARTELSEAKSETDC